jgi:hypothetical protein
MNVGNQTLVYGNVLYTAFIVYRPEEDNDIALVIERAEYYDSQHK